MRTRTLLLLAILATTVPVGAGGVFGMPPAGSASPAGGEAAGARRTPPAVRALIVLRRWDQRRSEAWARGDASALSRLYVRDSDTGAGDVRDLGRWTGRGLHVTGLHEQIDVLRVARANPRTWVVVLTERTVGGVAVGARWRTPLPASAWATHRVRLQRSASGWLVAEVRDQPAR